MKKKRGFLGFAATVAACMVLLFGCANIPSMYACASEIPGLKSIVRVLRVGEGGTPIGNAAAKVVSDSESVTISFFTEKGAAEEAASYSVGYYYEPARIQILFRGVDSSLYEMIKEKLADVDGVESVYRIKTLQEEDLAFAMVLKEMYDYEVVECANPGSLTIRFHLDAYYTEDEIQPGQMIYFIRTRELGFDEELDGLYRRYLNEKPTQVKNKNGKYILMIGTYKTRGEAELRYRKLTDSYGAEDGLYLSGGLVEETPAR